MEATINLMQQQQESEAMRLFLLDNDPAFRRDFAGALRSRGHTVVEAKSPRSRTPEDVHARRYDLAIVDLRAEDDQSQADISGQTFGVRLCHLGTPAVVLTSYPPPPVLMSALLRDGSISGFLLKGRLPTWEISGLIEHFGSRRQFGNGIASFDNSDGSLEVGPARLWRSIRQELGKASNWDPPRFEEFAVLFRSLVPPCATRVMLRASRPGRSGAALARVEISSGDSPVTEDLAVKFGKRSVIVDEMMRFDRHVGPLPDGTAAQLRYRAQTDNLAAIAYSWVGDSVEEGVPFRRCDEEGNRGIVWERRRATIARLFARALDGWYRTFRESVPEEAAPRSLLAYYLQPGVIWPCGLSTVYDLPISLGTHIRPKGESTLDFGSDRGEVVDPRWWLEKGWGHGLTFSQQCPCHGDLHVKNLYILPDGSPRLIDFGRTSLGHVYRDFAALEVSVRLTCVEVGANGAAVDSSALAKMEDVVYGERVTGLSDYLDYRHPALGRGANPARPNDIREAVRTTMEIRRSAMDASGAPVDPGRFQEYLFATVIHLLRYAGGEADEVSGATEDASAEGGGRLAERRELRRWHALYAAGRAATHSMRLMPNRASR
jgi:CheY-like chemotaxis protein